MITAVKIGILLLSNFGWWEFLRNKTKVNINFLPALTAATQFLLLFAAGILNMLEDAAAALYLFGLFCTVFYLWKNKWAAVKPYICWSYGFLLVNVFVLMIVLQGKLFAWQDSFTHWGLVTSKMLQTDRFPNFQDEVITFQNYPLAGSVYVYYFCKMVNRAESTQMLAQSYLILQLVMPLFAYAKKQNPVSFLCIVLFFDFLAVYNIPLTELLVDTLLPLAGAASLLFIHYHYLYEPPEKKTRYPLYYAVPLLCMTAQVKNSGLFFALFSELLLLWVIWKNRSEQKKSVAAAVCISPVVITWIWSRHCDYLFASAEISKHALTSEYLHLMGANKTAEDILYICKGVVKYFAFRDELRWLLVWAVFLGVLTFCVAKPKMRQYRNCMLFSWGIYVLYAFGQMGMYVFSMPLEAALGLECIDRYTRSADIVMYCTWAAYALDLISGTERKKLKRIGGSAAAVLLLLTWYGRTNGVPAGIKLLHQENSQLRYTIESPIEEYGVEKGYTYLVCSPKNYYDMPYFIWKYRMDTMDVLQLNVEDPSQMDAEKAYDYVIVLDEDNPIIQAWVQENYPDAIGKRVIQAFK